MPDAPRPHDLLQLADDWLPAGAPDWVSAALRAAPWVVVRRAASGPGLVPVGVRGTQRHQRYATVIDTGHIAAIVTPEQLMQRQPARNTLPAMALLARVRPMLVEHAAGPTGSIGFELASGMPAAHVASDLDLLLRPAGRLTVPAAQRLWAALSAEAGEAGCRIDVQVEAAHGAFALADYAQHRRVLLRTPHGAGLTEDPWSPPAFS